MLKANFLKIFFMLGILSLGACEANQTQLKAKNVTKESSSGATSQNPAQNAVVFMKPSSSEDLKGILFSLQQQTEVLWLMKLSLDSKFASDQKMEVTTDEGQSSSEKIFKNISASRRELLTGITKYYRNYSVDVVIEKDGSEFSKITFHDYKWNDFVKDENDILLVDYFGDEKQIEITKDSSEEGLYHVNEKYFSSVQVGFPWVYLRFKNSFDFKWDGKNWDKIQLFKSEFIWDRVNNNKTHKAFDFQKSNLQVTVSDCISVDGTVTAAAAAYGESSVYDLAFKDSNMTALLDSEKVGETKSVECSKRPNVDFKLILLN